MQIEQDLLVSHWPKPLTNDGRVQVGVHTAGGDRVPVWATSYRRQGQRRRGQRDARLDAGLVLLGISDRCPLALAAEVSLLAAMLGSLDEASDVLAQRGVELDIQTLRLIAYRDAARARAEPQIESPEFDDTLSGRRGVIRTDGGRLRLRETQRGPKTQKGRRRDTGAWREAKVLLLSGGDAEGKCEVSFAPLMDATLKGSDAVLALLRTGLQRLARFKTNPCRTSHIFRDFIDAVGLITLTDDEMIVRYQKRAHNPLLLAAGLTNTDVSAPWLRNKRLRLVFG